MSQLQPFGFGAGHIKVQGRDVALLVLTTARHLHSKPLFTPVGLRNLGVGQAKGLEVCGFGLR